MVIRLVRVARRERRNGKARVRVVGFDGDDADGQEDNEYVLVLYDYLLISEVFSLNACVM